MFVKGSFCIYKYSGFVKKYGKYLINEMFCVYVSCRTGAKRKKEDGESAQRENQNGGVLLLTSTVALVFFFFLTPLNCLNFNSIEVVLQLFYWD